MNGIDARIAGAAERIETRSAPARAVCLDFVARKRAAGSSRSRLSCGDRAHGFAASGDHKAAPLETVA